MTKKIFTISPIIWILLLICLSVLKYGIKLTLIWIPAFFILLLPGPILINARAKGLSKQNKYQSSGMQKKIYSLIGLYLLSMLSLIIQSQFKILTGALLGSGISVLVGYILSNRRKAN